MSMTANVLLTLAMDARLRLAKLKLPESAVEICMAGLARMEQVLARPPRVAIIGEVNAGKTSVAELLLGAGILPSSVVANTRVPILLGYAETTVLYAITQNGRHLLTEHTLDELPSGLQLKSIEIGLPSERLQEFEILDTPTIYEPGDVNTDAHIFVWCTVATRAWTESERAIWSALPRRCWRNALLVATHKDGLQHPGDITKVARRLHAAAGPMFRDVVFVSAAGAAASGPAHLGAQTADESGQALLERVGAWASEISERRARKADRIIRHLARLTLHQLAPAPLSSEAALILRDWQNNCARLFAGFDGSSASLSRVIQTLLVGFAQALDKSRSGSAAHHSPRRLPESARVPNVSWPFRPPAARRYARLIAADLTALLRIELARWALRDPTMAADYSAARAVLLPLANLDAVFAELGQLLSPASAAAAAPADIGPGRSPLTATRHP
jgi:hypothetical protein